jgi:hypothetical protein
MLECIIHDDACIDRSQCTFENVLYDERNNRKLPKNEPSQKWNNFLTQRTQSVAVHGLKLEIRK